MKSRFFQVLLLLTTMVITLTDCKPPSKTNSEEYKSPGDLAKERQTEIMECFINKDAETLKSFFSEYVIEAYPDIDTQIDEAFNFLDGEIASYDEPFSSESGIKEKKDYGATTRKILTDKGTEYTIAFKGWLSNKEDPLKEGITVIVIRNETIKTRLESNGDENLDELFRVCIGDTE